MSKPMASANMNRLGRKFAANLRVAELAKTEAVENLSGVFVEAVTTLTPKDTNRLARGWIFAGNEAGVSDMVPPPLNKSSRRDKYLKKLQKEIDEITGQINKLAGWMKKYEDDDIRNTFRRKSNGRKYKKRTSQPYYRKIKRLRAKFEKRLAKMELILESAEYNEGILFFDKSGGPKRRRRKKRSFSTIRTQEYRGSGEVVRDGNSVVVRLTNHEPHGRFVEKDWRSGHPVATALKLVKPLGLRKARRAALNAIYEANRAV